MLQFGGRKVHGLFRGRVNHSRAVVLRKSCYRMVKLKLQNIVSTGQYHLGHFVNSRNAFKYCIISFQIMRERYAITSTDKMTTACTVHWLTKGRSWPKKKNQKESRSKEGGGGQYPICLWFSFRRCRPLLPHALDSWWWRSLRRSLAQERLWLGRWPRQISSR